jgi:two-component sensor histidine kinase
MTLEDLYRLLRSGHVQAQGIVDTLDQPLLVLDEALCVRGVNPAYLRTFRADRDEVLGRNFFDLSDESWRSDKLRTLLLEVIPRSAAVVGYEVDLELPGQGHHSMLLSARRLVHPDNVGTSILLLLEDVTEARQTGAAKDILLAESQHRMKNLLAVIRALVTQTKVAGRSAEDYRDALLARFSALAEAQELLLEHQDSVGLEALLARSLSLFPQVRIASGPDVPLSHAQVTPLSFVFHELATNAMKYGALSVREGRVDITWDVVVEDGRSLVRLDWVEAGGPRVMPPDRVGFGSRLIAFSITNDLGGTVEQRYAPEGLSTRIEVPLT